MKRTLSGTTLAAAAAAALSVSLLAGCSIGPVNLDTVASDVSAFGSSVLGSFSPTSVEEAKEQRRSEAECVLSASDLNKEGTLTVGIKTSESAPLALLGSDGSYSGIDVDTAYALADQLGVMNVEFVPVSGVAAGLEDGCDVVMGVSEDDETGVVVVGSYVQSALGVFGRGEATAPIDAADLAGATIGVQSGSVSQSALAGYDLTYTEETFSNLNEAFDALDKGEVDYVVCDALSGAYLACTVDDATFVGTLDDPEAVGIAMVPTATSLQASVQTALDAIQTNGVADIARSRWIGALPTLTASTKITGLVEKQETTDEGEDAATEEGSGTGEGASTE